MTHSWPSSATLLQRWVCREFQKHDMPPAVVCPLCMLGHTLMTQRC
jgi:hypothetical protein